MLNVQRQVIGHTLISIGLVDALLAHPREMFRAAIVACASAIVLVHNHPSGDTSPSGTDISVTQNAIQAGQVVKIELLDHLIMGRKGRYSSLKGLGYFDAKKAA